MKTLSRRTLLRGAGAAAALPLLESMLPAQASAAVRPPMRMAVVTVTGGTVIESWRHPKGGPLEKLPSILRPLEPHRADLLLLTGLAHGGKADGLNAHEHAGYLHLTGAREVGKVAGKPRSAVSVDQLAAQRIGTSTYLPSLEIGFSNHETRYSWRAADQPVPFESNPRIVFDRMFRGRNPVAPNWARRAAAPAVDPSAAPKPDTDEQRVVDLVLEEARDLRGRLGSADKHRLEEYLHALGSVERRVRSLDALRRQEELDAKDPGPSAPRAPGLPEAGRLTRLQRMADKDPELHDEYTRLQLELMVLALQTDTTRVATFAMGSDEALFPGVVTVGYERHAHTLEHQGNAGRVEDADPIAREACRQIHLWYTGLFAGLLKRMKEIDEGGSSLLDNTVLLYTSYMADGGHGREDYPVCLAGRAQGTLTPGRQLDFPKGTPMSNLFVEMLDRVGVKVDAFGDSATAKRAAFGGRLPGLKA